MITVKTVSVHYERKQNLGDYSSAVVGCTLWADMDEEAQADLDGSMKSLWGMAKENVKSQLVPIAQEAKGKGAMRVEEQFLGLPVTEKGF